MHRNDERFSTQGSYENPDQPGWDGPMRMDKLASVLKRHVKSKQGSRHVIRNHSEIGNILVFNQESIPCKKRETQDLNTFLNLNKITLSVNLRCDDMDLPSISLEFRSYRLYEHTPIRSGKVRVGIAEEQNTFVHKVTGKG